MSTPSGKGPRICMPTWRQFSRKVFECGLYEAQDVLARSADVDLIPLQAAPGFRVRERWLNRLLYRDPTHAFITANPGLRAVHLEKDYDLFLTFCESFEDLLYVNAIRNWKARCRVSACWVDEIWAAAIPKYRHWLPIFQRFDHVFMSHKAAAVALSEALGREVHWLPAAVDVLRFTPYPHPPPIALDAYSVGRRPEGLHRELRRLAGERGLFYVHDTFKASVAEVYEPSQHRDLFAQTAKRSRYFLVAPPKFDAPNETAGEVAVGFRFYEGAAAGAVLLGQRSPTDSFDALFGWPDAVIDVRPDGTDLAPTLAALDADPARVAVIRQRNAEQALRRHDWIYRWLDLFAVMGVEPSAGMLDRRQRLTDLARVAAGAAHGETEARGVEPEAARRPAEGSTPRPGPRWASIIINNYNYGAYLRRAIESALDQTYPHVEVIVVDDGSTDDSRAVIASFGDRIRPVFKANGGQGSCFNAGFAVSRGEMVFFLDSDDYHQRDTVERVMACAGPTASLVQFRLWLVSASGQTLGVYPASGQSFDSGDVVPLLLKNGGFRGTVTTGNAFARAALERVLPVDEDRFRMAADGYLIRTAPFHGAVVSIDEPLACYRQHGGNESGVVSSNGVDVQQLRKKLRWADNEVFAVRDAARRFGRTVVAGFEYRSIGNMMVYRMASLKMDPANHPYPADTAWHLGARGAWSCLTGGCGPRAAVGLALWFAVLGVLPSWASQPVVNLVLHRDGLGALRLLKRVRQRFGSGVRWEAEAAAGGN